MILATVTVEGMGEDGAGGVGRRRVLGAAGLGVGAAAVAGSGLGIVASGSDPDPAAATPGPRTPGYDGQSIGDRFSRLFDAPPFATPDPELTEALGELGRPGGVMDAADPDDVGPDRLVLEPELSPGNPDNPAIPAGFTYAGQFLDHDITRDAGSRLGRPQSLERTVNLRTAAFDLDNVYGDGPDREPWIYDTADPVRFRVDDGGRFEDVPRNEFRQADIPDRRNDENLVVNGLHCAFLFFHNEMLDRARARGLDDDAAFAEARRATRWHYQWLVLHEWLPAYVGQAMVDDVIGNGRRAYIPERAQVPVEFQVGVFRMGHSMVRPSYRVNQGGDEGAPFFAPVFDPAAFSGTDPPSMTGGFRAPRRFIDWENFFDFGDGQVQASKKITPRLSSVMLHLPINSLPRDRNEDEGPQSLATRNLLRHVTFSIPSGQRIARLLGEPSLTVADLSELDGLGAGLVESTPLFYYVLREAELAADGRHLGPVGGRLLAEVFIGMLLLDPASYLSVDPTWTPTLPVRDAAVGFRTVDFLTAAGVDPASRAAGPRPGLHASPAQWRV